MATARRKSKSAGRKSGGSGAGKFVLGFLLAALIAGGGFWWWTEHGARKVTLVDEPGERSGPAMPQPKPAKKVAPEFESSPANEAKAVPEPPFAASEDAFEAGAAVYSKRCAGCHGTMTHDAPNGQAMKTPARQLLREGNVSGQAPGTIYAAIRNGKPAQGMPAYQGVLSDAAMWDVALLLKAAGEPLPEPVMNKLSR